MAHFYFYNKYSSIFRIGIIVIILRIFILICLSEILPESLTLPCKKAMISI